jgi:hypothetical protein
VAQISLGILPVLLFVSFIGTVAFVAFGAALLFTLFWAGVALAVLTPVLCFTFAVAIGVWIWGLASYAFARRCYALWTQTDGDLQKQWSQWTMEWDGTTTKDEEVKLVKGTTN